MEDKIINVPLSALHPHPRNNEFFDDCDTESFKQMKESIAQIGLLTPLRVSKDYTIISGHQRYRACQELGVEFVHVIVDEELEDEDEKTMQLIASNFGRVKNDPEKQAALIVEYEKLMGYAHGGNRRSSAPMEHLKTQSDISKVFGISPQVLRRLKQFEKQPTEIKEAVRDGKFTVSTAVRVLASMPIEDQIALINSLPEAKAKFTQTEIQERVNQMYSNVKADKETLDKQSADLQKREEIMAQKVEQARAFLTATQEKQEHAERQAREARAAAQKEEQRLAQLKEQAEVVAAQIRDMRENPPKVETVVETETIVEVQMPEDYEELQEKAKEAEILRQRLAEAEQRLATVTGQQEIDEEELFKDPEYRSHNVKVEDVDDISAHFARGIISGTSELKPYLLNCIDNDKALHGFSNYLRGSVEKNLTFLIENATTLLKQIKEAC